MKAKNLILSIVLLLSFGCDSDSNNDLSDQITPVLIAGGTLSGYGMKVFSRESIVIKTDSEWETLKQKINRLNNYVDRFTEKEIDFSTYQIIAVFDEFKGSSAWRIEITHIIEWPDKIVVFVADNVPKGYITADMAQPFLIVKIPVSKKKIKFEYDWE
jgi:hypothetical protein